MDKVLWTASELVLDGIKYRMGNRRRDSGTSSDDSDEKKKPKMKKRRKEKVRKQKKRRTRESDSDSASDSDTSTESMRKNERRKKKSKQEEISTTVCNLCGQKFSSRDMMCNAFGQYLCKACDDRMKHTLHRR